MNKEGEGVPQELKTGLMIAFVCHVCAIVPLIALLRIPHGAAIRPMGEACLVFIFTGIAGIFGVPLCLIATYYARGWFRVLAIVGIALNWAVFPASMLVMKAITQLAGFTLKD